MAPSALSAFVAASIASASLVAAQTTIAFANPPLDQLHFPHPSDAPPQVYPFDPNVVYTRGPQSGYNQCNATTEGPASLCQTLFVNDWDDFCLWGNPTPDIIANSEGEVVGYCSKKGHGTRIMAAGTITGMQILNTPEYMMITGTVAQTLMDINDGDSGGELDSGGQDGRGNAIGGLLYSTKFSTDGQPDQIENWTEFIGNNQFCIKICNPTGQNPAGYCQHTLDRIGLAYNCPSKYTIGGGVQPGVFEKCDSALMDVPGVYVQNGQTLSYAQPPESDGAITSIPYTPTLVASSNCITTASAALFTDAVAAASSVPTSSGSAAPAASGSAGAAPGAASGSRAGSASNPSKTGGTGASSNSTSNAVEMTQLFFPLVAAVAGVAGSIALMA